MGGAGLLQEYKGSPIALLSAVYPDYDWLPWKFSRCAHGYWDSLDNQKKFLEWAGKEWEIKNMEDWYKVKMTVYIV